MKKAGHRILSFAVTLSLMLAIVQTVDAQESKSRYDGFRTVGYYFEGFEDPIEKNVQFDRLTHIVYAFLIPNEDGSLIGVQHPEKLEEIERLGHEKGVKVILGVGGWSYNNVALDPTFEKLASSEQSREAFVDNILAYVEKYNLDGVDMDWEYPDIGESAQNYEKMIISLSDKLREQGKVLTAAVPGSPFRDKGLDAATAISNKCLERFDWINIMGYDAGNGAGHSPYLFSESSIFYWKSRGVPTEKLVIGVPFYARPSWKLYRDLIAEDKDNAYVDFSSNNGLESYYNGIYTIREKTRLALNMANGIMIWEINMDTLDEYSLHKVIQETVQQRKTSNQDSRDSVYLRVNGREVVFSDHDMGCPFIDKSGRMLMPIRKSLEEIGISVRYDEMNRVIKVQKGDIYADIPLGEKYIVKMKKDSEGRVIENETVKMDTAAELKDGRTYIPARYLFETFEYSVEWHEGSRTVIVSGK